MLLDKDQVNYLFHTDNNRQVILACYLNSVDNEPKFFLLKIFKDTLQASPKIISKHQINL